MHALHAGSEGFRWFIGEVEDRDDPLKLGRLRIRIYNVHPMEKTKVSTDNLPWAVPLLPITNAASKKTGSFATGAVVGTIVFGFFMDAENGNYPVVIGTLPGNSDSNNNEEHNDLPYEALGTNKIDKRLEGPEPGSAFGAKYPYNKVMKTESGHVIEIDDTPDKERIHVYHKSGTYVEINNDGRMVTKVADDDIEVVVGSKTVFVKGDVRIESEGNITIQAAGSILLNPNA